MIASRFPYESSLNADGWATLKQHSPDFASASKVMGRNEVDQCVKVAAEFLHSLREKVEMVARPAQSWPECCSILCLWSQACVSHEPL